MLMYIVLPLIFIISFFVFLIGIQIVVGIIWTKKHVPNVVKAHVPNMTNEFELHKEEKPIPSKVEFGSKSLSLSSKRFVIWGISLALSGGITLIAYLYGF